MLFNIIRSAIEFLIERGAVAVLHAYPRRPRRAEAGADVCEGATPAAGSAASPAAAGLADSLAAPGSALASSAAASAASPTAGSNPGSAAGSAGSELGSPKLYVRVCEDSQYIDTHEPKLYPYSNLAVPKYDSELVRGAIEEMLGDCAAVGTSFDVTTYKKQPNGRLEPVTTYMHEDRWHPYAQKVLEYYCMHTSERLWEAAHADDLLASFGKTELVVMLDFAENLGLKWEREPQSKHWSTTSVTLITAMAYRHATPEERQRAGKAEGERSTIREAVVGVSDDVKHDPAIVLELEKKIVLKYTQIHGPQAVVPAPQE